MLAAIVLTAFIIALTVLVASDETMVAVFDPPLGREPESTTIVQLNSRFAVVA